MKKFIVALVIALAGAPAAMAVEEPKFSIVERDGKFEIRDYAPVIVAETTLSGSAVQARNSGFQPLADYIFAKDRKGAAIAMTAPVTQAPREKIAMTAPVTQSNTGGEWTIGFTMPEGYTMDTLPAPANPKVRLVAKPARRMAVLRFSGTAGVEKMDRERIELLAKVADAGLTAQSEPVFAFYDPPWTLPFMRRNEVMVLVDVN
jgi:hypothetical protein